MRRASLTLIAIVIVFTWFDPAEAGAKSRRGCDSIGDSYAGVAWKLCEQAHDGKYFVPSSETTLVDRNGDLHLRFDNYARKLAPSAEWKAVNEGLQSSIQLQDRHRELNEMVVDLENTSQLNQFLKSVSEFNAFASKWEDNMRALLGFSDDDWDQKIVIGGPKGPHAYANIAFYLRQKLARLEAEKHEVQREGEDLEVTVVAFHTPEQGKRAYLRVEGYNNVEEGELRPAPSTGLALNPEEAAYLRMSLEMSEQAAASLREIRVNQDAIKDGIRNAVDKIRDGLDDFEGWVTSTIGPWIRGAEGMKKEIRDRIALSPALSEKTKKGLNDLVDLIDAYVTDFKKLEEQANKALEIRRNLVSPTATSLFELFYGEANLVAELGAIPGAIEEIRTVVKSWADRGTQMNDVVKDLDLADDLRAWALERTQDGVTNFLKAELPATLKFVETMSNYVSNTAAPKSLLGDELAQTPTPAWYPLLEPLDTTIDLRRVNWKVGDRVTVVVKIRKKPVRPPKAGDPVPPIVFQSRYITEAGRTGIVRRVAGNLVFFRPQDRLDPADEKRWKLNVAAMVNWRYFIRDATRGQKVLNWLGLGAGLHLANLNMADESVEFGVGANVSFWKGLLSVGTGWNLSVDNEPQYYLVGVDLLDALNRAKGTGKAKTPNDLEESGE